jgi:hypothetical protein
MEEFVMKKVVFGLIIGMLVGTTAYADLTGPTDYEVQYFGEKSAWKLLNLDGKYYMSLDDVAKISNMDFSINESSKELTMSSRQTSKWMNMPRLPLTNSIHFNTVSATNASDMGIDGTMFEIDVRNDSGGKCSFSYQVDINSHTRGKIAEAVGVVVDLEAGKTQRTTALTTENCLNDPLWYSFKVISVF